VRKPFQRRRVALPDRKPHVCREPSEPGRARTVIIPSPCQWFVVFHAQYMAAGAGMLLDLDATGPEMVSAASTPHDYTRRRSVIHPNLPIRTWGTGAGRRRCTQAFSSSSRLLTSAWYGRYARRHESKLRALQHLATVTYVQCQDLN
jgi:hypothetical protein